MTGRKCPSDSVHREAVLNMAVFRYVGGIVIRNEIATIDLPKCQEAGNG
jgi:hypothetical protein